MCVVINREQVYNMLSLEFSYHKSLNDVMQSPDMVRQLDWIDNVFDPRIIKDPHPMLRKSESTTSMYPQVQKYCLISGANSWTSWHIDFGGTSVWYHIAIGQKWFYLIPPTDQNLAIFSEWSTNDETGKFSLCVCYLFLFCVFVFCWVKK